MNLSDLSQAVGGHKRRRRVGRGNASGNGKTAGRGHKGAGSRSGYSYRAGHEGGQMPLIRRLPKRGFTNARFRRRHDVINLSALNRFEDGAEVTIAALVEAGVVKSRHGRLKILGQGDLQKRLVVVADKFSGRAREEIERLGGTAKQV